MNGNMDPLNYVASMNSRGVECLSAGRTVEAAQSFRQALRAMTILTQEAQVAAPSPPTTTMTVGSSMNVTIPQEDSNESMGAGNEEHANPEQGQVVRGGISLASKCAHFESARDFLDEQDFLYQQGLLFDPNSNGTAPAEPFDVGSSASFCMSAVILYNLALTCHKKSRSIEKERSLNKALRLYEMAADVLMNENESSLIEEERVPVILAILNNKAHALYELGFYRDAEQALMDIMELLQISNQRPPSFQENNVSLLLLHAHLQQSTKHAAAA